jgi:hypothetical protein
MAFAVNHKEAIQGQYLPPEGTFEVLFKAAETRCTQSGGRLIDFTFEIRSDVMQDEQGQHFHFAMFPLKTPTARDPEGYRLGTIQAICKAVNISEGTNFESLNDWLTALEGMPVKVEVKHRTWNDRDQINLNYLPTEFPEVVQGTAVNPDELPF